MCEDDKDEIWRRQEKINDALGIDMQDLHKLCFLSRVGMNNLLMSLMVRNQANIQSFGTN